jgi:hypothetical protein
MKAGTHLSALKLTLNTLSSSSGVSVCTFVPPVKQVSIQHLQQQRLLALLFVRR